MTQNIKMERRIKELLGIQSGEKRKQGQTINWHIMSDGVLLFIFGLLLLAVKEVSETPTWGLIPILGLIPPPPVFFSIALRVILIVISLILMIAILWRWQAYKRANSLKGRLKKAKYLIIFFLFLLLLFVLWLIPPIPVWFFTVSGIIVLLISLAFMVAVFWKGLADRLENFLKERQWSRGGAIIQYLYFVVFWLVYTVSWLKGLSAISVEEFTFHVIFWVGFALFLFIPFAWFKFIFQQGK